MLPDCFRSHILWLLVALQAAALSLVSPCPSFSSSDDMVLPAKLESVETETTTINGTEYIIPEPWFGHRLKPPRLDYSAFRRIPEKYSWNDSKIYIVAKAHAALVEMLSKAEKDGILLKVESGYRSEGYQRSIFKRMIANGRTFDDIVRYVAPPGYSGHVFGTAVDFYPSDWRFADTPHYKWLQENGAGYNFEETYSRANALKMPWEAWHWDYIGE